MKIKEMISIVTNIADEAYSAAYCSRYQAYDNTGFIMGDSEAQVQKVMVCLDITDIVIDRCKREGVNLIISHHPIIYDKVSCITKDSYVGKKVLALISAGIAVYAAHLSLDVTLVNHVLANVLGIGECRPLFPVLDGGMGLIGKCKIPMQLSAFSHRVSQLLFDDTVFHVGNGAMKVQTVALIAGGGGDTESYLAAKKNQADVYLSGDFSHHVLLYAQESVPSIVSASHYALEQPAMRELAARLRQNSGETILEDSFRQPYHK